MTELIERQKVAAAWLEWACGNDKVPETDPAYQQVTEGRDDPTPGYSSCGDLAHWMLFRLGVRLPWVNRAEHVGWRVGKNVSALCWPPAPSRAPYLTDRYDAGDVLIIWSHKDTQDAHVVCVINHVPEEHLLLTAEYGQPGGALKTHVYVDGAVLHVGLRPVQRVLLLADVLRQAEHNGDLVEYEEPPLTLTDERNAAIREGS